MPRLKEGVQKDNRYIITGRRVPTRYQKEEIHDGPEQKRDTKACVVENIAMPQKCEQQDISPCQIFYGLDIARRIASSTDKCPFTTKHG